MEFSYNVLSVGELSAGVIFVHLTYPQAKSVTAKS